MTPQEKSQIIALRRQGRKYTDISAELGLSVSTVKSFCYRHPLTSEETVCKYCGKRITVLPDRKRRIFCSDTCRLSWWKEHPEASNRKKGYTHICDFCGRQFDSYHAYNRFCSRKCYADARRKEHRDGQFT